MSAFSRFAQSADCPPLTLKVPTLPPASTSSLLNTMTKMSPPRLSLPIRQMPLPPTKEFRFLRNGRTLTALKRTSRSKLNPISRRRIRTRTAPYLIITPTALSSRWMITRLLSSLRLIPVRLRYNILMAQQSPSSETAPKRFRTQELKRSSSPLLARMKPKRNQTTSLLRRIRRRMITTPPQALDLVASYRQPTPRFRRASLGVSSISTWMAALESS